MDGSVRQSSRRTHPLFALSAMLLLSLFALFSIRFFPSHHVQELPRLVQPFPRAVGLPPIPVSNDTLPNSVDNSTSSAILSTSSLSSDSLQSLSLSSTSSSSFTPFTTSISSTSSSTSSPTPPPILSTPTTDTSSSPSPSPSPSPSSSSLSIFSSLITTSSSKAQSISTTSSNVGVDVWRTLSTSTPVRSDTPAESSSTGTSSSVTSSTTNRFWSNKGAVAGTFLFVGLLVVGIVAMSIAIILKRWKAKRDAVIDAEFMPQYQEPKSIGPSPTPSISSTPLDPFSRREVAYDFVLPEIPTSFHSKPIGQVVPTVNVTSPPSAFPTYLLPSTIAGREGKTETRFSTQSGYQPSFDSFYGAYPPDENHRARRM